MAASAVRIRKAASAIRAQITKRLRSKSVRTPVTIPYDVICLILEYADMGTLFAMSLVNRACSEAAYKYLWRRIPVHFCHSPHKRTVNLLKTLVSIPLRSRHVREFVITATDFKPAGTRGSDRNYISPAAHKIIHTFVSLLPYTTSLRIIRFQTHQLFNHYFREIISNLDFRMLQKNSTPFPFRLISLHTPASHFYALSRLISQQPSIRHLSLVAPNEDDSMSPFSSDILPHLESLTISSPYLAYVMGGRPVHTLDLTSFPLRPPTVSYLLDAIERGTTPLRSLMVSIARVDDGDSVKDDLSQLAVFPPVAPELRELVIRCPAPFPNWDNIVGEKTGLMSVRSPRRRALRRFTEILGAFQVLEVLEWIGSHASSPEQGDRGHQIFMNMCTRACPTLKRIKINGDTTWMH